MHRQSSVSSSRDSLSESGRIKRTAILRCCRAKKRACKIGDGENGRRVPHVSIPGAPSVSSNTLSRVLSFPCFPSVALFFSSRKKRHLAQTITPVPGAIGHQRRVKAAAITNSDSLIPFIPVLLRPPLRPSLFSCSSAPPLPPPPPLPFLPLFPSFPPFRSHPHARSHLHLPTTLVKVTL